MANCCKTLCYWITCVKMTIVIPCKCNTYVSMCEFYEGGIVHFSVLMAFFSSQCITEGTVGDIAVQLRKNWKQLTTVLPPKQFKACLSLVHTSDISISNENKAWLLLWDLRRQNNENFSLFRLLFCSALGLCLYYDLMLITILMSQAWLHSFVLPFVLPLCLCYRVNQALAFEKTENYI